MDGDGDRSRAWLESTVSGLAPHNVDSRVAGHDMRSAPAFMVSGHERQGRA